MEEQEDKRLMQMARKRIAFRQQLYIYLAVNAFLWLIWILANFPHAPNEKLEFPWPIYPMIGWGIGLGFQFYKAYSRPSEDRIKAEYEKLKKSGKS